MKDNKIKVYNYIKREISKNMIYSVLLLIFSLALLALNLSITVIYSGEAPLVVGAIGLTSIILLIASLYLNINQCLKQKMIYKESFYTFIGSLIAIVIWIICIIL